MSSQRRILVVATNVDQYQKVGFRTGLWLSELTHFWDVAEEAGHTLQLASPSGVAEAAGLQGHGGVLSKSRCEWDSIDGGRGQQGMKMQIHMQKRPRMKKAPEGAWP